MKKINLAVLIIMVLALVCTGCRDEEEKDDEGKLLEQLAVEFDVNDKECFSEVVGVLVDSQPVYVDEIAWYVFLIEDSMKVYSETYENGTGKSYWEQQTDGTGTFSEVYTDKVLDQIAYNTVVSVKARENGCEYDEEAILDNGKELLSNIPKEDIDKYGLTLDGYLKMQSKIELVDEYAKKAVEEMQVDEDKIKKEHPIEEFAGKINTKYLIVHNTYIDDNGEEKSYDNDTINALAAELKEARDKALDGESMEQVAKEYEHVDFHEGSFYVDMQGVAGAFASAAKALEVGQTSEVIMDATASYVITRLEDNTLEDYEEYITILVNGEKERVLEEEFTTLSQDASVRTNANVWKYMAVGKNKS